MATVKEHYSEVLSEVYSWMLGGFEEGVNRNKNFFSEHNIKPESGKIAVDLGCGCGFQSIPLADSGFSVTAIDIDSGLLGELERNRGERDINIINDDLLDFDNYICSKAELFICMTDTILHLDSLKRLESLFEKVSKNLEDSGSFVITFRDLTFELEGADGFIPVRSDENTIMTCFLEYFEDVVKVHDVVYLKEDGKWVLKKSFYNKLRLSVDDVESALKRNGFSKIETSCSNGLTTILSKK